MTNQTTKNEFKQTRDHGGFMARIQQQVANGIAAAHESWEDDATGVRGAHATPAQQQRAPTVS